MRRRIFRILALVLAIGVLAFVVERAGRRQPSATSPPPSAEPAIAADTAAPMVTATATGNRYQVIGPATKADPHTVRGAVEALITDGGSPAPPPPSSR